MAPPHRAKATRPVWLRSAHGAPPRFLPDGSAPGDRLREHDGGRAIIARSVPELNALKRRVLNYGDTSPQLKDARSAAFGGDSVFRSGAPLLLENLPVLNEAPNRGSAVVIDESRIRVRWLPFGSDH
jgi:hypothetical protein